MTTLRPTPDNTVIVGSFGKCTITNSVAPLVKTLLVTDVIRVLVVQIQKQFLYMHIQMDYLYWSQ